jgi:hypothetical protein
MRSIPYLFCTISLFTLAQIHALQPGDLIMPSVVQGACSVCRSTACANCPKHGSEIRLDGSTKKICSRCDDKGPFCSQPCTVATVFIPRSQGANTARELAGWEEFIHQYDVGDYYLTTGHVLGYYHSFHPERIARSFFGSRALHFAGSQVTDRGRCDLIADNFGLSPYFKGTVFFHPTISNFVFDNQFFIGLDPWACGLYARIHAPIVHTRWSLGMSQVEESEKADCKSFPACYMGPDSSPALCKAIDALDGQFTFGEMQQPWQFGRFKCKTQSLTRLADIDLILGYNIWQCDTYHAGFYAQLVAPTGNKPNGRSIFEPIVGNAKHWELGIGFSGHLVLWERDADMSLAVYLEGNMTHMFKNRQMRSFDFCDRGPLSRYLLLKEFAKDNGTLTYTGNLVPGINVATRQVDVSVPLKGDMSAKLSYRSPCFIVDLGYNFYGKLKEKIRFVSCAPTNKFYAIKGTEGVCGLEYATVGTAPVMFGPLVNKIALNSSQSEATIQCMAPTDNPTAVPVQNPTDIVVTAFSRQEGPIEGPDVIQAFNSVPPVLLDVNKLDKKSGRMRTEATHKVFGYLGYNFYEADWCYNPYLGIGGELEFDARACSERTALNQWGVWVKGGFEF